MIESSEQLVPREFDAEGISERCLQNDNVEGSNDTFGAATSISKFVTVE